MLDKIKTLSKQTLIYGTSTIVGRLLNFLLVPFYTNIFSPGKFGVITLVFAYIAMLIIFYSIGFESGYFKFASTLEVGTPKQNFTLPFATIFINSAFLTTIFLIFPNSFAKLIGLNPENYVFITYSALILFFDAIVLVPFASLRLHNKPVKFTIIKIIYIVVNVAMNFILVLVFKMGLISVFISNLTASIITFLILLPDIIKNLSFSYNSKLFNELWRFSLPYVPAGLAYIMIQVISRPIMQFLTDDATIGIFQAMFRLGIVMMLIAQMFEYAWRPFFLNNANEPNAKEIFSKVLTIFVGFSSLVLIIITFFIEDIIKIPLPIKGHLIGQEYWGGVYIVPIILFSYLLNGIYYNFMAGIYIEKKTKYLPLITGTGVVINVVFNFLLIPKFGLYGAAFATFFSYLSMAIYIYMVSQKYYPVKYDLKRVLSINFINCITLTLFYLIFYQIIPSNLIIKLILSVILIFIVVYLSDLLKAKKLFAKTSINVPVESFDETIEDSKL
jgi:O-antigen/teichoic acid export membrane protein